MPKSFDPALAAAPPETDVVRAIYEGLTDVDPKTLRPIPAIAIDWNSSDNDKIWTFRLRGDAKWSNGERVTAKDFERSWKRLAEMGEEVSHYELFNNIVGMQSVEKLVFSNSVDIDDQSAGADLTSPENSIVLSQPLQDEKSNSDSAKGKEPLTPEKRNEQKNENKKKGEFEFGVKALDDNTLKVSLIKPDKDFPTLVAHPIFRPIYKGQNFQTKNLNANIVTNGAFQLRSVGQDGITLVRAEHYWNAKQVKLERVRFVPMENAEKALEAYRAGEIDAVTNAEFEPLALKLLAPFDDFRRTIHAALNFYEFNLKKPPFDDRRVRQSLAMAIDRERLTEGEMEGSTEPALKFLPFQEDGEKITQNSARANELLSEAGFPKGEKFPVIKLLINRNNTQQQIAKSVAKMWKQNLGVETEIIVKDSADLETFKQTGDFDLIRRGVVLPTSDETVNILTIFPLVGKTDVADENTLAENKVAKEETKEPEIETTQTETTIKERLADSELNESDTASQNSEKSATEIILTEKDAIFEMQAIPLYFSTSYSLVKPYVRGFEMNILDAPSLKDIEISNDWQPKAAKGES